jgi:hypothetical protein
MMLHNGGAGLQERIGDIRKVMVEWQEMFGSGAATGTVRIFTSTPIILKALLPVTIHRNLIPKRVMRGGSFFILLLCQLSCFSPYENIP